MEISMTVCGCGCMGYETRNDIALCRSRLRNEVSLPYGEKKIYAVFTKRARVDSFEIVPSPGVNRAVVDGFHDANMFDEATRALGKAHKKGFRYVHIEY